MSRTYCQNVSVLPSRRISTPFPALELVTDHTARCPTSRRSGLGESSVVLPLMSSSLFSVCINLEFQVQPMPLYRSCQEASRGRVKCAPCRRQTQHTQNLSQIVPMHGVTHVSPRQWRQLGMHTLILTGKLLLQHANAYVCFCPRHIEGTQTLHNCLGACYSYVL